MSTSKLAASFAEKLLINKKVGGDPKVHKARIEKACNVLFTCIAYFMLRDEPEVNFIDGNDLTRYVLDKRLRSLVLPCKVSIRSDRKSKNLVDYDYLRDNLESMPTKREFDEAQDTIFNLFKEEVGETVNMFDECGFCSLEQALDRSFTGNLCHFADVPFLPIKVDQDYMKAPFYNSDVDEMIEEALLEVSRNLRNR